MRSSVRIPERMSVRISRVRCSLSWKVQMITKNPWQNPRQNPQPNSHGSMVEIFTDFFCRVGSVTNELGKHFRRRGAVRIKIIVKRAEDGFGEHGFKHRRHRAIRVACVSSLQGARRPRATAYFTADFVRESVFSAFRAWPKSSTAPSLPPNNTGIATLHDPWRR